MCKKMSKCNINASIWNHLGYIQAKSNSWIKTAYSDLYFDFIDTLNLGKVRSEVPTGFGKTETAVDIYTQLTSFCPYLTIAKKAF